MSKQSEAARADLDKLLDFYQVHKPEMIGKDIKVYINPKQLRHFAAERDQSFYYRNCRIIPLDPPGGSQ